MQKVVIDTNVIVSALIQKSYPYLIMHDLFLEGKFELCLSEELMKEYIDVLSRKKFSKYEDFFINAKRILFEIGLNSQYFEVKQKISLLSDKDDNKLLELISASKANYLITGDINDFTIHKFKKTKIVTPREYWEKYRPE
jgi:putative PIN family toxin of toxin-antitoxin system